MPVVRDVTVSMGTDWRFYFYPKRVDRLPLLRVQVRDLLFVVKSGDRVVFEASLSGGQIKPSEGTAGGYELVVKPEAESFSAGDYAYRFQSVTVAGETADQNVGHFLVQVDALPEVRDGT